MARMNSDQNWLLRKAKEEANGFVCVGGLAHTLGAAEARSQPAHRAGKHVFSRLVNLRRRELKLSVEQLAEKADVDLEELVDIEIGEFDTPEPRTVHQIARVLKLPEQKLMLLAGLTVSRDEQVNRAAVRFAARSDSIEKLSPAERDALEEFVRFLADA